MKIVVLDGYTLNPGDLSWKDLEKLGNVKIYDRSGGNEIFERCVDADVLLTNKTPLSGELISKLPSLKYIGVIATGFNIVDIEAATERGVAVTNVPGYGTPSVAQLTFSLLLALCVHAEGHSESVRDGKWSRSKDWSYWDYPLAELKDKTIGILGFGDIGKKVADIATAFGMNVIATSRTQTDQSHRSNFRSLSFDELLRESDVISIHCPLTDDTKGLFNEATFRKMKPTSFLINSSRGPIIIDQDLADALNKGIIAGAGIDVLSPEPPPADNPLFKAKNCIITPHIAWATKESRQRLMNVIVHNLEEFIAGRKVNVVNE
ncbi:D-2-hydroxyacid dehydrogenase [soil metagenome]